MNSKPGHLLGENPDEKLVNLHKILVLFSEINAFHKITSKDIKEKMKLFLTTLKSDQFFAQN